jgi:ATP-dependent Clp protease ATP-binding subunit ClpC
MLENLTESARKAVLHARLQAKQLGSAEIEPEHLLLGILDVDETLLHRCIHRPNAASQLRSQMESHCKANPGSPAAPAAELVLSVKSRRAVAYAQEESQRLHSQRVDTEHLLLGILREESCYAAVTLRELGVTRGMLMVAAQMAPPEQEGHPVRWDPAGASPTRDLTAAAAEGQFGPLIGREREFDRMVHILLRRGHHSVLLVGESGVGKTALIEGLAARLASGMLPKLDRRLLSIDAAWLGGIGTRHQVRRLERRSDAIVCVEGLLDMESAEGFLYFEPGLGGSQCQCIATGTPAGFRRFAKRFAGLARRFAVVEVAPNTPDEATEVLRGLRERYEKFHNVAIEEGAIPAAVFLSGRVLPTRFLPDRALDLLDDAGARARLRGGSTVTAAEIAESAAERAGVPVAALERMVEVRKPVELELVVRELAGRLPEDQHAWLPFLAAFLAGAPAEAAERLVEGIRSAEAMLRPPTEGGTRGQ